MKLKDKMVIIQMRDRKGQKGVEVVVGESRAAKCASSVSSWEEPATSLMMVSSWEETATSLIMMMLLLVIRTFHQKRLGLGCRAFCLDLQCVLPFTLSNDVQRMTNPPFQVLAGNPETQEG